MHPRTPLGPRRGSTPVALLATILVATAAAAAPTLGFHEGWSGSSLQSWGGGYLDVTNGVATSFGTRCLSCPAYAGNWVTAGITQVRVRLNDVNTSQAFEIHFGIGNGSNFWQYNPGFVPPPNAWGAFVVDLTSADWTQTAGDPPLTLTDALMFVDRIHFRHDIPPFERIPNAPDPIAGDLGIDDLLLTDGIVGVGEANPVARRPVLLAPPYPNPARGPVTVSLRAHDSAPVHIQIVDVSGRIVREAELAAGSPGPRTWMWDGLDARGAASPPGSYRIRAFGSTGGMSRTLVRIR